MKKWLPGFWTKLEWVHSIKQQARLLYLSLCRTVAFLEIFVVLKGAIINEKTSAKSLSAGMKKLRDKIFAEGKVVNLTTTEDILFSSSSAAADFVLGYSVSGPRTWKTKDGRTLKEIEDRATVD